MIAERFPFKKKNNTQKSKKKIRKDYQDNAQWNKQIVNHLINQPG